MGAIVAFDYGLFIARYPEFIGSVPPPTVASFTGAIATGTPELSVSSPVTGGTLGSGSILSGTGIVPGTYIKTVVDATNFVLNYAYADGITSEAMSAITNPQVSPEQGQLYFNEATLFLRNDGSGPVQDNPTQSQLLNMLVAHIAVRYAVLNGTAPSFAVGRVSQASQGPASMSWDFNIPIASAQWYAQTPYGFDFWQATAAYRTMRYRVGPRRNFNPWFGGRGFTLIPPRGF